MPKKKQVKKAVKKPVKKKAVKVAKEEKKEAVQLVVAPVAAPVAPPADPYKQIEASISGVPKNFIIRCPKCCWSRVSSGVNADLKDLNEVSSNCANCGKRRKFQCPKCGNHAMMKRFKGNS